MNLAELTAWAPRLLRSQSFPSMTLLGTFASKEEILGGTRGGNSYPLQSCLRKVQSTRQGLHSVCTPVVQSCLSMGTYSVF